MLQIPVSFLTFLSSLKLHISNYPIWMATVCRMTGWSYWWHCLRIRNPLVQIVFQRRCSGVSFII